MTQFFFIYLIISIKNYFLFKNKKMRIKPIY